MTIADLISVAEEIEDAPADMPVHMIEDKEHAVLLCLGWTSREEHIPGLSADYGEDLYGQRWTSPTGVQCWQGELPKPLRCRDHARALLPDGWDDQAMWFESGKLIWAVERAPTIWKLPPLQVAGMGRFEMASRTAAALRAKAVEMEE